MDWNRITQLREQFQEKKGEANEDIVRELLTYIQEMKPRLEVINPPNLQQTYLDFSNIPKNIKEGSSKEMRTARIYTELETMIIRATHTSRLTDTQRDKLDKDVVVINATLEDSITSTIPSPNDLYLKNSLFKKFADSKIKAMASYMASNGKIVDTLAAYEHPQGWLTYERNNRVQDSEDSTRLAEVGSSSKQPTNKAGGYMPVKRVNDE